MVLTVREFIEQLSTCPMDRKVYVSDDSISHPAIVKPEHQTWEADETPVVLITWETW